MNQQISWDQSIIKKFSSSNHLKLLNQLRTEVKKYPLNKKKNISSDLVNYNKTDITNNKVKSIPQDDYQTNNANINKDINMNKSNISFNNSKNFSIYNQVNNNDNFARQSQHNDQKKPSEVSSSQSFKERLDQIDMK